MRDDLGPTGNLGPGEDFQAMRKKAQAGSLVAGAKREDGSRMGPKPQDVYPGRQAIPVQKAVEAEDIARREASNQDKYGSHREKIRTIPGMRGWGR